jgi:hypothetical protein
VPVPGFDTVKSGLFKLVVAPRTSLSDSVLIMGGWPQALRALLRMKVLVRFDATSRPWPIQARSARKGNPVRACLWRYVFSVADAALRQSKSQPEPNRVFNSFQRGNINLSYPPHEFHIGQRS